LLCPILDVNRGIDDSFTAASLHRATSTTRGADDQSEPLVTYFVADFASMLAPLETRLYIIDPETDQSASLLGNPLRTGPIPSRCPPHSAPCHVIRFAPQHHCPKLRAIRAYAPSSSCLLLDTQWQTWSGSLRTYQSKLGGAAEIGCAALVACPSKSFREHLASTWRARCAAEIDLAGTQRHKR